MRQVRTTQEFIVMEWHAFGEMRKLIAAKICQFAVLFRLFLSSLYRSVPKFLDRQVWANSVDPEQTAPRGTV